MTEDRIELDYDLTAMEWARARDFLRALAIRKKDKFFGQITTRPPLMMLMGLPCIFINIPYLLNLFDHAFRGTLPIWFDFTNAFWLALIVGLIIYETILIVGWTRCWLGIQSLKGIGPEGVHWGTQSMIATNDTLIVEREKSRSIFQWRAFLGIEESEHALFLMLTRHSAVVVPKSAFDSEALENSFRNLIDRHVEAAT